MLNPVFAPVVRKPGEVLSGREVRKAIPSFACPEVEQHIQRFPSATVKYLGWQIDTGFYVALDIPEYYLELNKSGHAPIDPVKKEYMQYYGVHMIDTLHRQVLCRRYVEDSNVLMLTNGTVPSWSCLHSLPEPGCFRFFKMSGPVDFVQLDMIWTRTVVPYMFQFSCGREMFPFSRGSMVKLFIEHNSSTGEWRNYGYVIRKAVNEIDDKQPVVDPESVMCEAEKEEWRLPLPQIPPSKVQEMFSASKVDNCQRYVMGRNIQREIEARKQFPEPQVEKCGC